MCASLHHLLSQQHAFQQVSRLISVACAASLLLYLRMDLLAPLFGLWQDRPHQINIHGQIAVVLQCAVECLFQPKYGWSDFADQIELHPETIRQYAQEEDVPGCEGSFPVGSFLKVSCRCNDCFGCLERLVIQLKPSCFSILYT